ncbi:hypothetical protein ACHAXT_010134 [Thalassiosira profunda]
MTRFSQPNSEIDPAGLAGHYRRLGGSTQAPRLESDGLRTVVFPRKLQGGGRAVDALVMMPQQPSAAMRIGSPSTNSDAGPTTSAPVTIAGPPPAAVSKFVALSDEQSKDLAFPVGCPVWYNFTRSQDAIVEVREGVVASAELDIFSKTLAFKVAEKAASSDVGASPSVATVLEDDIAYAAGCPVVLSSAGCGEACEKCDGEVMYVTPMKGDNGKEMRYIVKTSRPGSTGDVCIEEGVKPDRLKYREVCSPLPSAKQGGQSSRNRVVSPVALEKELAEPSEVSVESKESGGVDRKKPGLPNRTNNDTHAVPAAKRRAKAKHARRDDHGGYYHPGKISSRQYQREHEYSHSRRDWEGKRSYDRYSGKKPESRGSRESSARRSRDDDYARTKASHNVCKRKSDDTEKPQEKKIKWEPPSTWHEHDGAI